MIAAPMCTGCRHRFTSGLRCRAFPEGIPQEIIRSMHDHRLPWIGDSGIQFLPVDAAAEEYADFLFEGRPRTTGERFDPERDDP